MRWARFWAPGPAERIVPPSAATAFLIVASAAAMAYLAVIALSVWLTVDRVSATWRAELTGTATVRLPAAASDEEAGQVLEILAATEGVLSARQLDTAEQAALLSPWFGDSFPVDALRLPVLIDVAETGGGPDRASLRAQLVEATPNAVYDSHDRWTDSLLGVTDRLRGLALGVMTLLAMIWAIVIALGASASVAANGPVIDVLRRVGARDAFITRAFVRRFTLRALGGAAIGMVLGGLTVATIPGGGDAGLGVFGPSGFQWFWLAVVPPLSAAIAFAATQASATRRLRKVR